jgi:hypothetical protein
MRPTSVVASDAEAKVRRKLPALFCSGPAEMIRRSWWGPDPPSWLVRSPVAKSEAGNWVMANATQTKDGFESYKRRVEELLRDAGWSVRGVFKAFGAFKVAEAFANGESPESFASRVDSDAPLGMAS